MTAKELLELKQQIAEAKERKSSLQGRLDYLNEELKNKYKCSSVKKAEQRLDELDKEAEQLEQQIETKSEELQTILDEHERTENSD